MEKEELLKKYIDEIKTHRFYELIPYLMDGGFIIEKSSIKVGEFLYTSFMIANGKPFDGLVMHSRSCYRRPIQISWQLLTSDGYITEDELNRAMEMSSKAYESIKKVTKEDTRTDEKIDDNMKLFRKLTEMMSMDIVGVTGKKTPFSEFARIIKEMDDIISKRENK